MWLRVGEKKGVEQTQQVFDVLSALTEHVDALTTKGSSISRDNEERSEPCRGHEADVGRMTSLLHKLLIARQYRSSGDLNTHSTSPTALLLIVLDDVWDDFVISALGTLPAAFVVTSRDMNILQRVFTPVKMVGSYRLFNKMIHSIQYNVVYVFAKSFLYLPQVTLRMDKRRQKKYLLC